MLNLKEFESSIQTVSEEEVLRNRVKGKYLPYIEAVMKKARALPEGKSIEVDLKDAKLARIFSLSVRHYLDKVKETGFVSCSYKTYVVVGRRTDSKKPKA